MIDLAMMILYTYKKHEEVSEEKAGFVFHWSYFLGWISWITSLVVFAVAVKEVRQPPARGMSKMNEEEDAQY